MTAQTQTGGLRFAIVWPNAQPSATLPKKLIPFNTQTIVVAVEDPQTEMSLATPVIINRSSNPREEVTIQGIRPGSVRVIAAAFATSPPSGDPLAVGEANTSVSTGQTTDVNVTLFAFAPPPPPLT